MYLCTKTQVRINPNYTHEKNFVVQVISTWHNRLVYDARQPKEQRKTWVINGPSDKAELRPYGLLGPVELTTSAPD